MICRIVYSSAATGPWSSTELEQLLTELREKNSRQDVTGVLIFADGVFLQVLEGDRRVLDTLVPKIRRDGRHQKVTVFHDVAIDERSFKQWRMAYVNPSAEKLSAWAKLEGTGSIDDLLEHLRTNPQFLPAFLVNIISALAEP